MRKKLYLFINKKMGKENFYKAIYDNGLNYERIELFNDFIQTLLLIVYDTYLGDEIMNNEDKYKHFMWCWNKTKNIFEKEDIYINSEDLINYFHEFLSEVFYKLDNKPPDRDFLVLKMWENIFDINKTKSETDLKMLIELYKIFDNSVIFK